VGEQASRTKDAGRKPSAFGAPAVRAALLFVALVGGVTIAFLALARQHETPPFKGLDRPDVVVMSSAPNNEPAMTYSVEVHRTGEVIFHGGPEVLLPGRHVYMPPAEKVTELFETIDESRFRWLKQHYSLWIGGDSKTVLCLRQGQTEKCVDARGERLLGGDGAPPAFDEIRYRIPEVAGIDRWLRADERTSEVFRDEGLDPRSVGGRRLMLRGVENLSPETFQALIEAGFPIDAADHRPNFDEAITPVELAAEKGRGDVLRVLLAAGAFKGASAAKRHAAVVSAAKSCRPEAVQALADAGVKADRKAAEADIFLCTYHARPEDRLATARLLLNQGVSPNARDAYGRTALFLDPEPEMVELLLRRGADPNVRNKSGVAPLLCIEDEKSALALIKGGARIDGPSSPCSENTPPTIDALAAGKGWTQVQALLAQRRGRAA